MRAPVKQFLSAGDMSADITSNPILLDQDFAYAIQAIYTTVGSLGGSLSLQASLNYNPGTPQSGGAKNDGDWTTITDSPETISGAGNFIWNVTSSNYQAVRLVYTATGGDTGTLSAFYKTRGF